MRSGRVSRRARGAVVGLVAGVAVLATACGAVNAPPMLNALRTEGGVAVADQPRCAETPEGTEPDRVDPAAAGLDPALLGSALDYAVAKGSQSVRVYRHGCLIGTGSNDPSVDWVPLPGWSATKGVVSMLAGRAVTLGRLDIDAPIGGYLNVRDPRKAALTARQLLNQTTGLRMAWVSDLNEAATTDSVAALMARPFEAVPGTTFDYAQTTVTALVAVVEAAVGEDLQSFAQRELFGPIGVGSDEWTWERDGAGRTQGFAFLSMTPTAFGRLGRLLLQNGEWDGRRLISADYIAQGRAGTAANPCYGFLWRNNDGRGCHQTGPLLGLETTGNWMPTVPEDAYGLSGMFDQLVLVIPSLDMVVVRLGLPHQVMADPWGDIGGEKPAMTWRFFRTLMASVTDTVVADPGEWQPSTPGSIDWAHIFAVPLPEPTW